MGMDFQSQYSVETTFNSPDYELIEKIGEGGFGHVYKALQHSTQKLVAIKFLILSPDFDQEKKRRYIERFHRESDLIRRLNHPNIVHLIDKGQQNDFLIYAVYEYIDGCTLKEHLDTQGALSAVDTAEIMACVLDALSHAHEKGVIHRDIKPANIMLYQVGAKTHVKVLDFGIGTLKNEVRQLDYKSITLTQETLGTPTYSSPEQLRGEPPVAQTDIYVWGLVFLECLTGVPTITGRSLASIFHQQLSPTNVPLGVLAGHNSAPFFRRVLNKKSHERPVDTAELYHEFQKLNFTNLTGTSSPISNHHTAVELSDITQVNQHDETLLNDGHFSYSRLTERKQISVLSVILTTGVLPSEGQAVQLIEQDVIDTFHSDQMQQCIDLAVRYGATHVGSLGDTLLFYFGYPKVSDNDSRLCSRAALDIVSNFNRKNALLKNSHGIVSHIQMGMQAGLMQSLVGNIPEGKAAHDAMNLCRQAKPGQIVCSESVKLILESYLNFERLIIPASVNRLASCVEDRPYLLRSERLSEAFGFLRSTQKNRAFIGREQEIATLVNLLASDSDEHAALNKSQSEETQYRIAHIQGEAGIGKSRLVFELRERVEDWRHLVAQCLPEHQNNALYPILTLLKVKYALEPLSDTQKLARLTQAIEQSPLLRQHQEQGLLVLAAWLNLLTGEQNVDGNNALSNLSPALQKQRLFDVVSELLCQTHLSSGEKANHKKQHLFIFEDLHWADPTSKEFIHFIVQTDAFKDGKHSWLNTSREAIPTIMEDLSFTLVQIDKLSDANVNDYIAFLFNQQPLSQRLTALLLERTDGIPLFIEELASTLQNQKLVHKVNGIVDFVDNEKQSQVPVSLRESLQQRLDWLEFSKDTAQLAATIGRTFNYDLLVAASSKDEAQVQIDLDELIKAELIYQQRQVEGDSYIFKHALVRDAAYESMDGKTHKISHLKVAEVLVKYFPMRVEEHPNEVAIHFSSASRYDLAINYGIISANSSLENFSIEETIYQGYRVCTWIENIPENVMVADKIEINRILMQALMLKYGWGHNKIYNHIDSTRHLFVGLKTSEYSRSVVWSLVSTFVYYFVVGQKDGMVGLHKHVQEILNSKNESGMVLAAHIMQGFINFNDANLEESISSFSKVVSLYDEKEHKDLVFLFGVDMFTWAKSMLGIIFSYQGKLNLANSLGEEAISSARALEHVPSICIALLYRAIVAQFHGNNRHVKKITNEIIEFSDAYSLPAYKGYASLLNMWATRKNNVDSAISIVSILKEMNCNAFIPYYASLHADTLAQQGSHLSAVELIDDCLLDCKRYSDFSYEAELYLRRACYLLGEKEPNFTLAKSDLHKAIYLSESRGNKQTKLHAKKHLSNLLQKTY
ncbi:TOMM system kinase/cyclase fusion protein [Photobacterium minamisatsumaniensis]|uniref:TOMM system kinase/cyclase fusion protein n=1 Tax=Photobacterium minamisatsumaniensis TaxID=2910233 RepID=UPI003D131500